MLQLISRMMALTSRSEGIASRLSAAVAGAHLRLIAPYNSRAETITFGELSKRGAHIIENADQGEQAKKGVSIPTRLAKTTMR